MSRKTHFIYRCTLVAALALAGAHATAASTHAHVHGNAALQVALDGDKLTLELTSPLDSLVGFEHAPRTEKQQAAVRSMADKLHRPDTLFVPTAEAKCGRATVTLSSPVIPPQLLAGGPAAKPVPAAPAPAAKGKSEHAELVAEIVMVCEQPARLTGIDVKLFEAFPPMKRIDARAAVRNKQAAARLTPRATRLSF